MSRVPWVFIPWTPGTNCHHEMAEAFVKAGARAEIIPLKRESRPKLYEADLIAFAGGFSWGDHFGSGTVAAIDFSYRFRDELLEALNRMVPMLGICNGFQILVRLGLLPQQTMGEPNAVLDLNLTSRFEHWWKRKLVLRHSLVWTSEMNGVEVHWPTAHAEGRLVLAEGSLDPNVIATYGTPEGTAEYPISPNGSPIAGVCDPFGLIAGFMPHPERRIDKLRGGTDGLAIFESGVNAVR